MAPKMKQSTKGNKQIIEENIATLKFYRNMSCGSTIFHILVVFIFFEPFSGLQMIMTILTIAVHLGSYYFMSMMSRPQYTDGGSILDSGSDLNLEGGIAEHVKDIIILTAGTQLLSLLSDFFWLLLLLGPLRAAWIFWNSVVKPGLSQKNDAELSNERKQKQSEKKMKRVR
ncbi:transmembrane protein 208 [Toxorhynchites rutilus septentrionalis]|uniref:transmembrane protein 208 n=1 Tax=Toxorhynchites rutilus septentrionalis TaxID=329112 RepID=UPI00247AE4B8|nr:transmembrane protein 208 [Toxorhynchites rutilus septentrionalis]